MSAEFEYGLGDQMRLVQENGRWRVATNPLAFYDQTTPKAALRSFIRAYRLERWDIMLRFVPTQYRDIAFAEACHRSMQERSWIALPPPSDGGP